MKENPHFSFNPTTHRVAVRRTAGWGGLAKRFVDRCQHAVQIPVDIVVPETQHAEAAVREISVSPGILCGMPVKRMLATVDFYHQPMSHAREVDNVSFAR